VTVTVLGIGLMGAGMARSLARAGLPVTVWNRTPDKARALAGVARVTVAEDLTAAVSGADVVITMLFDADAVEQVMTEALPALGSGAIWVQTSTVGLDGVDRLAALAGKHGVSFVDAPVLGTRAPAEQGTLTVLASGPMGARDAVAPVFDAIGSRTIWAGEQPGAGHRLKLVANSWVLSVTAATAQAVALAGALDLEPGAFLDLIAGGPLDSGYAQTKGRAMIEGNFAPAFTVAGAIKDAALIGAAMRTSGVDDGLMSAVHRHFSAAGSAGHNEHDMAAVVVAFQQ
jgi:3-hydroxyisobutyrate dehydrogenase